MVCLIATPAWASAPTEIASVIHSDAPYGTGKYTFLLMTAYDAELWTDAPQWSMDKIFALTLRYHMDFSTNGIVSRSLEEMKHVDPSLSNTALSSYSDAMAKTFPSVKDGDEITALYEPGKPVRFFLNGAATGEIADATFATDFFAIWLSPQSSDLKLRQALLKLK
jgi:Chalcone isomerase-like